MMKRTQRRWLQSLLGGAWLCWMPLKNLTVEMISKLGGTWAIKRAPETWCGLYNVDDEILPSYAGIIYKPSLRIKQPVFHRKFFRRFLSVPHLVMETALKTTVAGSWKIPCRSINFSSFWNSNCYNRKSPNISGNLRWRNPKTYASSMDTAYVREPHTL